MDDVEPIPITSGANLGRTCSNLRPPAVVTEFMSQGSVKSALARKSEVVVGNMHRVVVAMDAAKVWPPSEMCRQSAGHFEDMRPYRGVQISCTMYSMQECHARNQLLCERGPSSCNSVRCASGRHHRGALLA